MKKLTLLFAAIVASFILGGCNPNIPELKVVEPSQTAYLMPLDGQTSNQTKFNSEAFLEQAKVASKRVTITQTWRSTGSFPWSGEWLPSVRLVVVERKPQARHWVDKNGITAESKESIGFVTGMACTAQIDETDATRFLYRYNNKPLETVMDEEILNRVRSKFVELCATYNLADLLTHKADIMRQVREDVDPFFKDRGINITSLGLVGELTYVDDGIQASINRKFQSQQDLIAQQAINEKNVSKAKADAQAAQILNNPNALKLKQLELQSKFLEKWDGNMPKVVGSGGIMLNAESLMQSK
jgi:outer membrane murein-binding lipoprotein Lpp